MKGGEIEVFEGKKFSELLSDIYHISSEKRLQIGNLITELSKHLSTAAEAVNMAPIIQDFLEVSVKNDDQLVKMAATVQKLISSEVYKSVQDDNGSLLSEEDIDKLRNETAQELKNAEKEIDEDLSNITKI